jgi:hypothetical protein
LIPRLISHFLLELSTQMWLFKEKSSLAIKKLGEDSDLFHEVRVGLRFIQTFPHPLFFLPSLSVAFYGSLSHCLLDKGPGKGDICFVDAMYVVAPLW